MIVRGIENGAITLGEFELPPTARMRVYRVNASLDHLDLVTLASAAAGVSGAIIGTKLDAAGANDGCVRVCCAADAWNVLLFPFHPHARTSNL